MEDSKAPCSYSVTEVHDETGRTRHIKCPNKAACPACGNCLYCCPGHVNVRPYFSRTIKTVRVENEDGNSDSKVRVYDSTVYEPVKLAVGMEACHGLSAAGRSERRGYRYLAGDLSS